MMDQRWKIRANGQGIKRKLEKYRVAVVRKKKAAQMSRPCTSWPRPGMKKLARAAMTLPESPRRLDFLRLAIDSIVFAV